MFIPKKVNIKKYLKDELRVTRKVVAHYLLEIMV